MLFLPLFLHKVEFMPNFKNADVRMKVIARCLSDRNRWYTTAQIFERCNKELIGSV